MTNLKSPCRPAMALRYGSDPVPLPLGLAFHRSELTLMASQARTSLFIAGTWFGRKICTMSNGCLIPMSKLSFDSDGSGKSTFQGIGEVQVMTAANMASKCRVVFKTDSKCTVLAQISKRFRESWAKSCYISQFSQVGIWHDMANMFVFRFFLLNFLQRAERPAADRSGAEAVQVSFVRAELSTRWTKQRRAELTWQMLAELRPKAEGRKLLIGCSWMTKKSKIKVKSIWNRKDTVTYMHHKCGFYIMKLFVNMVWSLWDSAFLSLEQLRSESSMWQDQLPGVAGVSQDLHPLGRGGLSKLGRQPAMDLQLQLVRSEKIYFGSVVWGFSWGNWRILRWDDPNCRIFVCFFLVWPVVPAWSTEPKTWAMKLDLARAKTTLSSGFGYGTSTTSSFFCFFLARPINSSFSFRYISVLQTFWRRDSYVIQTAAFVQPNVYSSLERLIRRGSRCRWAWEHCHKDLSQESIGYDYDIP